MIEKYNCTFHILINKVIYLFTFSFLISPKYDKYMKKTASYDSNCRTGIPPSVFVYHVENACTCIYTRHHLTPVL